MRPRNQRVSGSACERCWNHNGGTCAWAARAGNASGSTVRSDRTSAGTADAPTNDDADRAARTPVTPIARDARVNLVDLRVGNKPETFAGETHEWKGWSFKMRQYIAAVDEEVYLELVDVEANPLRELPLAGMNEPLKKRARQLAFMLTMHTKEGALQMITKLSDPANGFEIWRRFLEEWEPAHRGRYRAMQLLQFPFARDRSRALEEWERLVRQYEAPSSDTIQDTIKAAILAHISQDPESLRIEWKAMHQAYRQWSMADGNDSTQMEVDALTKGKGKSKGKGRREGQRERQSKEQGQAEGRNARHVEYEVFLLQGERPHPKGSPQVLGLARREEDSGSRAERECRRGRRMDLCLGPRA